MRQYMTATFLIALLVAGGCARPPVQRPAGVREVEVTGRDFQFEPGTIELQAGVPVRLVFRNAGTVSHDLQILDMPADIRGKSQQHAEHGKTGANGAVHVGTDRPGQTATIEFVPTQPGEYKVICSVPGHAEAGMEGKVVVR